MRIDRLLAVVAITLATHVAAFGQGAILQGGPSTPGHAPMYVGSGQQGSQTVVQDSGPASGGGVGRGLSETLQVNRGAAGTGTGPLGTHNCFYDAATTSASGYHYLCLDANAQGGGLIAYGAGGAAAALPLQVSINGILYRFPFTSGSGRTVLTAPLTFYVDGTGTDVPGCGLAVLTAACRTIQYAVGILSRAYDFAAQAVTIQLAHGTYAPVLFSVPWTGGNNVTLQGDLAAQGSVIIDGSAGTYCVEVLNSVITVQGLAVQNCALELAAAERYGQLYFKNITFNAPVAGGLGLYCSRESYCEVTGGGNIINAVGANFIQGSHQGNVRVGTGGTPFTIGADITLTSGCFVYATSLADITFTDFVASAFDLNGHSVTGCRWAIDSGGVIQTLVASASFFPGSTTGVLTGQGSFNGPLHVGTSIFSGGGASPTISGNDYDGVVTEGAGSTGIVILFGGAFNTAPVCTVSYLGAVTTPVFAVSTSTLGTTHAAGAVSFAYHCSGG